MSEEEWYPGYKPATECILANVIGRAHPRGYREMGRHKKVHHVAWESANQASLLPGSLIMHMCDNRLCINPKHLRLGTRPENNADARAKGLMPQSVKQAVCGAGHPMTEDNLYAYASGYRCCKICAKIRSLKHYYKRQGAKA